MKYFWWIVGFVVLGGVVLVMKFSFKPRVVSLIGPSTLTSGSQFAGVVVNQMRAYFDQRRIVLLGLPNYPADAHVAHIDPKLLSDFAQALSKQTPFHSIWLLGKENSRLATDGASWGAPVHVADSISAAADEISKDLAGDGKILVITSLSDSYGLEPGTAAAFLGTHFPYDQYMVLSMTPVRAVADEMMPTELRCEDAPGSAVGGLAAAASLCATDLKEALAYESAEMIKSKKIDRSRPVASVEQRSSSFFVAFVRSPPLSP